MGRSLADNERSMMRGLGAASAAAALEFILSVLIRHSVAPMAVYILCPVGMILAVYQLLSDDIADAAVRAVSCLAMTAAYVFLFIRIGYKAAIFREIDKGILDGAVFERFFLCFLICAGAAVIAALAVSALGRKSGIYRKYIENHDKAQSSLSVVSIAAALICAVIGSMIYG